MIENASRNHDSNYISLIRIKPTYPEPGYGYIKLNKKFKKTNTYYDAVEFLEKPTASDINGLIEVGDVCWNSGIFLMSATKVIKANIEFDPVEILRTNHRGGISR